MFEFVVLYLFNFSDRCPRHCCLKQKIQCFWIIQTTFLQYGIERFHSFMYKLRGNTFLPSKHKTELFGHIQGTYFLKVRELSRNFSKLSNVGEYCHGHFFFFQKHLSLSSLGLHSQRILLKAPPHHMCIIFYINYFVVNIFNMQVLSLHSAMSANCCH